MEKDLERTARCEQQQHTDKRKHAFERCCGEWSVSASVTELCDLLFLPRKVLVQKYRTIKKIR